MPGAQRVFESHFNDVHLLLKHKGVYLFVSHKIYESLQKLNGILTIHHCSASWCIGAAKEEKKEPTTVIAFYKRLICWNRLLNCAYSITCWPIPTFVEWSPHSIKKKNRAPHSFLCNVLFWSRNEKSNGTFFYKFVVVILLMWQLLIIIHGLGLLRNG